MKRKQFLSAAATVIGSLHLSPAMAAALTDEQKKPVIPPYLRPGDTIGITSPAGYISREDCVQAIRTIEGWGYCVKIGDTIGKKDFSFGGTDEERKKDFDNLLRDREVKAIMCARGGYGIVRIIDAINFQLLVDQPKWLIGFSDATVLHSHLNKNFGIASLHSKMCNSFPDPNLAEAIQNETVDSIRRCLGGEKMKYTAEANIANGPGRATGILVGGNLKTLESLAGTKSDISTKDKILFTEDTGEYLYSIDRMFYNLQRSGKLAGLAGLIIGGFKIKKDEEGEAFGRSLEQIVTEKTAGYNYPVCFDFPVGHQKNNYALKCGVLHELIVADTTTLSET